MRLIPFFALTVFGQATLQDQYYGEYSRNAASFRDFLLSLEIAPNANFTASDLLKIETKLADTNVLKDLVFNEVVSANLTGLSIPEKEARDAVLYAVVKGRDLLQAKLLNTFSNKTDPDEIKHTREEIQLILVALNKVQDLDGMTLNKAITYLDQHPYLVTSTQFAYYLNQDFFEKDVLNYINLFFTMANENDPRVSKQLQNVLNILQMRYKFFPAEYYQKVRKPYVGSPASRP